MIDQELKKKIVNTISRYELKCDKLQIQIDSLKNVINQLIINPVGIDYESDDHFAQLRAQLDAEFDAKELEKKVNRLVQVLTKLQKKKLQEKRSIINLFQQGTESIGRLANKSQDKRAVSKLEKMINTEMESHAILVQFNEVLNQCVSSVKRELEDALEAAKSTNTPQDIAEISIKVNDSLQQLLNHLSIPHDLDNKKEHIKNCLESKLTGDDLSKIIDGLTELVVDAFNLEQNRFKGFLQQVTNQLQDFHIYLQAGDEHYKQASKDSLYLESGIQDNIQQIKDHFESPNTIEELSAKVSQNLNMIEGCIKTFRDNEKDREKQYEEQVSELRAKLNESEQNAEEIKNLLTFQKYKINHDSLTNLPNRESYDEHILEAFQRWKHTKTPLSLAVGDIDHFKRINDNFGHLAGDKVLKKVASIFKSSTRSVDFIARVGGEEFLFIFESTSSQVAAKILDKLRKSIEECQFIYREHRVNVTVSFGLTTITASDDIESLFMRADNAMYKAKNAGRNRIEVL